MDIKYYLFPYKIQHDKAPPAGVWLSKRTGNCSHVQHHGCHWTYLCMHTCIKGKVKSNLVFQILYIFQDLKKKPNRVSLCHARCPSVTLLLQHPRAGAAAVCPSTGPTCHWGCFSLVHPPAPLLQLTGPERSKELGARPPVSPRSRTSTSSPLVLHTSRSCSPLIS